MGLFHRATVTPGKADFIAEWAPTQSWGPAAGAEIEVIGSYRFDDPENRVGMETHIVASEGGLLQIPWTYRDEPVDGAGDALLTEMHHTALGTRFVYDGLRDDRFLIMLAAVTMTGQGEALGLALHEDRWYIAPSKVRISGGGWTLERVPVDGFELLSDVDGLAIFVNDRFELRYRRRPVVEAPPAMALTATWPGQAEAVVLAEVVEAPA